MSPVSLSRIVCMYTNITMELLFPVVCRQYSELFRSCIPSIKEVKVMNHIFHTVINEAERGKIHKPSTTLNITRRLLEIPVEEHITDVKRMDSARVKANKISEEIKELKAQLGNKIKVSGQNKTYPEDKERKSFTKHINVSVTTELTKSKYYIGKCIGVIKNISKMMDNADTPPDGIVDYARRQVRTKEFTSRFTRVYLYSLLTHISKVVVEEKCSDMYPKFTCMYQLIYQALQAFFNHLPNTVGPSSYQKLRECLNCAIDICDKSHESLQIKVNYNNEDFVHMLKSDCVDLAHKIEDDILSISTNSLLNSRSTRTSLLPTTQNKRNMVHSSENKLNLGKRLSMYNTNLTLKRGKHWKKMIAAFDNNKPKVKSRYQTATFKHRPPMEKSNSQTILHKKPLRLDDKTPVVLLSNTPVVTPINEDQIQTLIQYETERNVGDNNEKNMFEEKEQKEEPEQNRTCFMKQDRQNVSGVSRQQDDILTKILELVKDSERHCPADTDVNLTNKIMVLQKYLGVKSQNTKLLRRMEAGEDQTVENSDIELNPKIKEPTQKKEPMVTKCGSKNAQLICITDDNSIISITNGNGTNESQWKSQNLTEEKFKSIEVQTSIFQLIEGNELKKLHKSRSNVKVIRVSGPKRLLQLLPKHSAINIIHSKLMIHKHHKRNYMYKKTFDAKPWELMENFR